VRGHLGAPAFLENPETGESRVLRRVITAFANMRGEFSEAEVWLFSAETCARVIALIDARFEGRYSNEEWGWNAEPCLPTL
jgi:hypothetical protein